MSALQNETDDESTSGHILARLSREGGKHEMHIAETNEPYTIGYVDGEPIKIFTHTETAGEGSGQQRRTYISGPYHVNHSISSTTEGRKHYVGVENRRQSDDESSEVVTDSSVNVVDEEFPLEYPRNEALELTGDTEPREGIDALVDARYQTWFHHGDEYLFARSAGRYMNRDRRITLVADDETTHVLRVPTTENGCLYVPEGIDLDAIRETKDTAFVRAACPMHVGRHWVFDRVNSRNETFIVYGGSERKVVETDAGETFTYEHELRLRKLEGTYAVMEWSLHTDGMDGSGTRVATFDTKEEAFGFMTTKMRSNDGLPLDPTEDGADDTSELVTDGGVDVHDNAEAITIDAHTIAETVWEVARNRADGRDGHRWFDAHGNVFHAERKSGLTHIDDLVDVDDLMTGHPLPLKQDDDYEEIRELVVTELADTIRTEEEPQLVTDGGMDTEELCRMATLSDEDIARITDQCADPLDARDFHGRWVVPVYPEDGKVVIGEPSWEGGNEHIRWNDDVLFTFGGFGNERRVRESFEYFRTFRG